MTAPSVSCRRAVTRALRAPARATDPPREPQRARLRFGCAEHGAHDRPEPARREHACIDLVHAQPAQTAPYVARLPPSSIALAHASSATSAKIGAFLGVSRIRNGACPARARSLHPASRSSREGNARAARSGGHDGKLPAIRNLVRRLSQDPRHRSGRSRPAPAAGARVQWGELPTSAQCRWSLAARASGRLAKPRCSSERAPDSATLSASSTVSTG